METLRLLVRRGGVRDRGGAGRVRRGMFGRFLVLAFVVVPLVELALLVQVGRMVGVWPTIGLVLATGVAGGALARAQGVRTIARIQGEMAQGRMPGRALLDGAAILAGGAMLLTPGVLTDLLGFALLIPLTRRVLHGFVAHRLGRAIQQGTIRVWGGGFPGFPGGQGEGDGPAPGTRGSGAEGPAEEQPYRPGVDRSFREPPSPSHDPREDPSEDGPTRAEDPPRNRRNV